MTIRPASPADVPRLSDLAAEAFDPRYGEGWNGSQLAATLAMPISWAEVFEIGEQLAGFSMNRIAADDAELLLIAVCPAYRRKGIGKALLDAAMASASDRGARHMHLEVRHNNEAAIQLYNEYGFRVIGRRTDYYTGYRGEKYHAITMARYLP